MTSLTELLPIGAALSLLANKVLETASAAKDVLIDKESFKTLSKYLYDVEPFLEELQCRELNDSPAARQAIEIFENDLKKAKFLVEKYKNRGRFYLLVRCRQIVKEVQVITRAIGKSLAILSLASTEVLTDISETVNRLHSEMQNVEFAACQSQVQIVEKLDQGLHEQKIDQAFAKIMLEDIARAVGVPIKPSEISKELNIFKREKEEAAAHKEQAEALFLEQVIKLLSLADDANYHEEVKVKYYRRLENVKKLKDRVYIPPLKAFMCPFKKITMIDPVSLCTGTTCERASIQAWIDGGNRNDPETGQFFEDLTLRPNIRLKQTIEEWRELNYCLIIQSVKEALQSSNDLNIEGALCQIRQLIEENPINRDWIALEGIIDELAMLVGSLRNRHLKRWILVSLRVIVEGHTRNKDKIVESGSFDTILHCLGRDPIISEAAVELLFELLQDCPGSSSSLLKKLSRKNSALLFLVTLMNSKITESAEKAEAILLKLCDGDDDAISHVADANWYKPLINRLCEGPESSKLLLAEKLVQMELVEQNIQLLGEGGAIPPLLQMASGSLESKKCAFGALAKLSRCHENQRLIAVAGGVPLVLDQLFSLHVPTFIRAQCSEILEQFCSSNGMKFIVGATGSSFKLDILVTNLLAIQQIPNLSNSIRKPTLHALLGICKFEAPLLEKVACSLNGVSIILPLLEDTDLEVREVSVNLLFFFSQHHPLGIADFLLENSRLQAFLCFMGDNGRSDVQKAAVGLLAHLPKSNKMLTKNLIKLEAVPTIFNILRYGDMQAKENALGAMFRFADPDDIDMQRTIVEMGAYPLFLSILKCGTVKAKERAAALMGDLSLSTPKLTVVSVMTRYKFFRRTRRLSVCEAHGGICTVTTSFCLLKANALPDVVKLLKERVHETSYAAIKVLTTLVPEELSQRGSSVLHEFNAIAPMFDILYWGTSTLTEEVLQLLEKVLQVKEVAKNYCSVSKTILVSLATGSHDDGQLGRRAARVLNYLDNS